MSCPEHKKKVLFCHPVFVSLDIADKCIFLMSSSNTANRRVKACRDSLDIRTLPLTSSCWFIIKIFDHLYKNIPP